MKKLSILLCALFTAGTLLCTSESPVNAYTGKTYTANRLAGDNRFQTAIAIANEYKNDTLQNVVLATAYNYPDALAGSVLAHKLNAPILLLGKNANDSKETLDYIQQRLQKSGTIYLLGGSGVISDNFIKVFNDMGYKNIKRLGGTNREDTARLICDAANVPTGTPVFVTSGYNFSDALSVSSVAAAKGYPILLTDEKSLSSCVSDVIKSIKPTTIYLIGGLRLLDYRFDSKLKSLSPNVVRIHGSHTNNRYETSMQINKYFNLVTGSAVVATGDNFPDALTGGLLAAKNNAPFFLVGPDVSHQKQYLDSSDINDMYILGGTGAVSAKVEEWLTAPLEEGKPVEPILPADPSIGLKTPTGIISTKITYKDIIPDNPTLEEMLKISTTVTHLSNPELFIYDKTYDSWTLDWEKINMTGKILHSHEYIRDLSGSISEKDEFILITSMEVTPHKSISKRLSYISLHNSSSTATWSPWRNYKFPASLSKEQIDYMLSEATTN